VSELLAGREAIPSDLIGCPECDLLFSMVPQAPGEKLSCPRCNYAIAAGVKDGFVRPLCYAISALIFLLVSLSFPFLSLTASGLHNEMTLPQAIIALSTFGANAIAVLMLGFVIAIPGAMMAGVVVLTIMLLNRRASPVLVPLGRILFQSNAWAMVEVFAISVIVSLVKIASMAKVTLGISFWAYIAFAACFVLTMTSLDRLSVWSAIENLRVRR
jgi:paraquat-inducible protein A